MILPPEAHDPVQVLAAHVTTPLPTCCLARARAMTPALRFTDLGSRSAVSRARSI
ncbi:hypothetical protein [Gemmata sp. SH-PL17]|uniref:hypothetical protein n=1 Tax=Gemmata sp. SH-PL17 TaxID=1630693 RepID=UPI0012F7F91F|nr:hypothetical protein [Gemmata sp. SH-PL17]